MQSFQDVKVTRTRALPVLNAGPDRCALSLGPSTGTGTGAGAGRSMSMARVGGATRIGGWPFVVELLKDPDVVVQGITPNATRVRVCPGCGQGTLVLRRGPYSEFLGCSRYPACTHTIELDRSVGSIHSRS